MEYYILLPDDDKYNLTEANLLGEVSIGSVFWPSMGLQVLQNISEQQPELLKEIKIINGKSTVLTLENFMIMLDTMKIKKR